MAAQAETQDPQPLIDPDRMEQCIDNLASGTNIRLIHDEGIPDEIVSEAGDVTCSFIPGQLDKEGVFFKDDDGKLTVKSDGVFLVESGNIEIHAGAEDTIRFEGKNLGRMTMDSGRVPLQWVTPSDGDYVAASGRVIPGADQSITAGQ